MCISQGVIESEVEIPTVADRDLVGLAHWRVVIRGCVDSVRREADDCDVWRQGRNLSSV